jgi:hypothetical protein
MERVREVQFVQAAPFTPLSPSKELKASLPELSQEATATATATQ